MTAKELAEMLFGREVGDEVSPQEEHIAKNSGLVAVYGYSDDNVEFVGAINDEVGAYNGTTIYLTPNGILPEPDCDQDDCPYFTRARDKAKTIKAVWHDEVGPCWTFETDIPHETFTIMEDGEPWCIGIVFSLSQAGDADIEVDGQKLQRLIERNTPKKPMKVNNSRIRYASEYICSSCGGAFTGTGIADYCYHCGQRLDWS